LVNSVNGSQTNIKLEKLRVSKNSIQSQWKVKFDTMLTDEEKD
jgi:hypothetical protein